MTDSGDQVLPFGNMDESWVRFRPTSTPVSIHQQFDLLFEHPLPLNMHTSFSPGGYTPPPPGYVPPPPGFLLQIEREIERCTRSLMLSNINTRLSDINSSWNNSNGNESLMRKYNERSNSLNSSSSVCKMRAKIEYIHDSVIDPRTLKLTLCMIKMTSMCFYHHLKD